ncbi:Crp/Fnr family transcriptional regulator [Reichenbachiella versicolor]|uniref:Crp/Fnr family transcriptional regulator n=1 Tax=Reichenbachiella versicolor TaxID=1821036 RepID=UPI000D6DD662|nr:Crp/Fnr family transcriptional regulator [Reichenbachiella versicolor]
MSTLQDYFIGLIPMPEAKADQIATYFKEEEFTKDSLMIKEGRTSRKSYFLQKGIIRCYLYNSEGEEITTRFYSAPDFLNDYYSFFKQRPSIENYQALTDCQVWSIDLDSVQYCFHNIPEFREWGRMLLTMNYVTIHESMIDLRKLSAMDRYLKFLKEKPEIVKEIPLKFIASYLGITKHSLSRIRKELAEKEMSGEKLS